MFKYITHPTQHKLPVMNRGGRVPGMYYNGGESPSVMRRYLQGGNGEEQIDFSNIDTSNFNFTPPNPNAGIPSDTISELSAPISDNPLQYMENQEAMKAKHAEQSAIDQQARLDASKQGDYSAYKWKETYPEFVDEQWNPTGVNYYHNNPRPATIDIPHNEKAFRNMANNNPVAGFVKGVYNTFKTRDT